MRPRQGVTHLVHDQRPKGVFERRLGDHRPRSHHYSPSIGRIRRFTPRLVSLGTQVPEGPVAGPVSLELHHDQGACRARLLGESFPLPFGGLHADRFRASRSEVTLLQTGTARNLIGALHPSARPEHRLISPVRQFPEIGSDIGVEKIHRLHEVDSSVPAGDPANPHFPEIL